MGDQHELHDDVVLVAAFSSLREGRGVKVTVDGEEISLWKVGPRVHALGNVCAHQHFARMHEGHLDGDAVVCPMHGWAYALETGTAVNGSGRIPVFAVKIIGDKVYVSRMPVR